MADEEEEEGRVSFASLPPALLLAVFARLPADARARCSAVCRGWRDTLMDVSLWTRLDLSPSSGVAARVTDDVLRGASGLARGGLTVLDLSGVADAMTHDTLLAVAVANAGALTELHLHKDGAGLFLLTCPNIEGLLRAAPLLRTLDADVNVTATEALRMLRNEAPFGPLRVRRLDVECSGEEAGTVAEVTAAIAAHAFVSSVFLATARLDMPGALDALVDAALMRCMSAVTFFSCSLSPASAPALARLLGGRALRELVISNGRMQLLDVPAAVLLSNALRANSTLTTLTISRAALWADPAAAVTLLGALTGHVSLGCLDLKNDHAPTEQGVALIGPALGALVAANTPMLKLLHLFASNLGDAGMRPLLEALPHNTHLHSLECEGVGMSAACARDVLLPAVRANTSLQLLDAGDEHDAAVQANALVDARAAR
jgi:hypothetical protein